jgi:hypothetical protein
MTYQEYLEEFKKMADDEVIEAFNKEVGNPGWTTSRANYLGALRQEFDNRKYDCSVITQGGGLSLNNKVRLVDKKFEIIGPEIK